VTVSSSETVLIRSVRASGPRRLLTSLLPIGNPVISLPSFYAAVVAGSFFYGYLRLASGSIWPASIAHPTHNSVSAMISGFTVTSAPVLVNGYLLGEFGIVITAAAAIAAALVSRLVPDDNEDRDSGTHPPVADRRKHRPALTLLTRIAVLMGYLPCRADGLPLVAHTRQATDAGCRTAKIINRRPTCLPQAQPDSVSHIERKHHV
jgi:hypothetical protein